MKTLMFTSLSIRSSDKEGPFSPITNKGGSVLQKGTEENIVVEGFTEKGAING